MLVYILLQMLYLHQHLTVICLLEINLRMIQVELEILKHCREAWKISCVNTYLKNQKEIALTPHARGERILYQVELVLACMVALNAN